MITVEKDGAIKIQVGALSASAASAGACTFFCSSFSILQLIGGRLFTLQPFSAERFGLEGNSPRSKRFRVTFKFPLESQNSQI